MVALAGVVLCYIVVSTLTAHATDPGSGGGGSLGETINPGAGLAGLIGKDLNEEGAAPAPMAGLSTGVSVDPMLGSAMTSIPIQLPPGRKLTPDLVAHYSSNAPNGPLGIGWKLGLGSIHRDVAHGVPTDQDGDYLPDRGFVLDLGGQMARLDYCIDCSGTSQEWRSSVTEELVQATFNSAQNRWQVDRADGNRYIFGEDTTSRTGADVASASTTFGWALTAIEDYQGNSIDITYTGAPGSTSGPNLYAYLNRISYGGNTDPTTGYNHIFFVDFTYESRPDLQRNFQGGFAETIDRRLEKITVSFNPPGAASVIRAYELGYDQLAHSAQSVLASVALVDPPGDTTTPPPPTTFTYYEPMFKLATPRDVSFSEQRLPYGLDELADVDGDSIPDLVTAYQDPYRNEVMYGSGSNFGPAVPVVTPVWFGPGATPPFLVRWTDLNGDSAPDPLDCYLNPGYRTVWWNSGSGFSVEYIPIAGQPEAIGDPLWRLCSGESYINDLQGGVLHDVGLPDINGDGIADILEGLSGPQINARFGLGDGRFRVGVPWNSPVWVRETGSVLDRGLVDLNGDGLPDMVDTTAGEGVWNVYFNTGYGFADDPVPWAAPVMSAEQRQRHNWQGVYYFPLDALTKQSRVALRDINGDGLVDYIDGLSPFWRLFINTGSGFDTDHPISWIYDDTVGGTPVRRNFVRDGWETGALSWTTSNLLEINGDGLADLVDSVDQYRHPTRGPLSVAFGKGVRPGLLKSVSNGLGATTTIEYGQGGTAYGPAGNQKACILGDLSCNRIGPKQHSPFIPWVVASVRTSGASTTDHLTHWTFGGAYYDFQDREFRGFRESTETMQPNDGLFLRKVSRRFAAAPYTATEGDPEWPQSEVASRPFKLVEERVRGKLDNGSLQDISVAKTDWEVVWNVYGTTFIHPKKTVEHTYGFASNGSAKSLTREWTYNSRNLVASERVSGDASDGTTAVDTSVKYYSDTCSGLGCLPFRCSGVPTELKIAQGGTILSSREFWYDSDCRLGQVRERLATAGQSADAGTWVTTLKAEYNESASSPDAAAAKAGQPTRILDARGAAASPNYGTQLSYTCSHGIFPCTITNALGHVIFKAYDLRWGKATSLTDQNNQVTSFGYDGLGRLTSIIRPLASEPARRFLYTFGAAGSPATPSKLETQILEPADSQDSDGNGSIRSVSQFTFFDAVGRPLASRMRHYVGALDSARVLKTIVRDAVEYDARGRVTKRFVPYTVDTEPGTYAKPAEDAAATVSEYDALDRVIKITHPDGSYRDIDFRYAGEIHTYDENYRDGGFTGSRSVARSDSLGLKLVSELHEEGDALRTKTTTYKDGLYRVTQVTVQDPATLTTATTTFEFDSLGRRTKMVDPNSGTWTYQYDASGNLIFQNDPKTGQHIESCYDKLNRISRKLYPADDVLATNRDTLCSAAAMPSNMPAHDYVYDESTANGCTAYAEGRLCAVSEQQQVPGDTGLSTVKTKFLYDQRGRPITETSELSLRVAGTPITRTYGTRMSYDVADRLLAVGYPTTTGAIEYLYYGYTATGELDSASFAAQNFVNQVAYDVFGRRTVWNDGSGLRHAATFSGADKNYRLDALKVVPVSSSTALQTFDTFQYDKVGNVRGFVDREGYGNAFSVWSTYAYDGLSRLTNATRFGGGGTSYTYDGVGNMTAMGSVAFPLSSTAPNQIMSPAGVTSPYTYDLNGGMTQRPDLDAASSDLARTATYDPDGRLHKLTLAGGNSVRSVYDYRGQRVARIENEGNAGQRVTYYYGRYAEVTGTTLVRHIYFGGQLVAESPIPAPSNMALASLSVRERAVLVARLVDKLAHDPNAIFAGFVMTRDEASKTAALLVLTLLILGVTPGRVRIAFVSARHAPFRRLRRGHVLIVVMAFAVTTTPLSCVRVADAGTPSPGQPISPVYFVSSDHLGSTTMLTCYKIGSTCADRSIARYYRYDAYGKTTAYNAAGTSITIATALFNGFVPERLYTGQRWDDAGQVYDYGARFYDPRVARFLTHDPVQQYMNPYAYVMWNPLKFVDPTGMWSSNFVGPPPPEVAIPERDHAITQSFRAAGHGGMNGPNGGGPGGGFGARAGGGSSGGSSAGGVAAELGGRTLDSALATLANLFRANGNGAETPGSIQVGVEAGGQSTYATFSIFNGITVGLQADVTFLAGALIGAAFTAGAGIAVTLGGPNNGTITPFWSHGGFFGVPEGLLTNSSWDGAFGVYGGGGISGFVSTATSTSQFLGEAFWTGGFAGAGTIGASLTGSVSSSGIFTVGFSIPPVLPFPTGYGLGIGGANAVVLTRQGL